MYKMFGKYVGWMCYKHYVLQDNQNDIIFTERRQKLVKKKRGGGYMNFLPSLPSLFRVWTVL